MNQCSNIIKDCPDIVQLASQLGRLDFISAILASIAVILVLGGIAAFYEVRRTAKKQAKKVAEEYVTQSTERLFNTYIQKNWPTILEVYGNMLKEQIKEHQGEVIAQAQEDQ